MMSKPRRFLAFLLTALMLVEMIPAAAYAEVGEAIANAANEISLQAENSALVNQSDDGQVVTNDRSTSASEDSPAEGTEAIEPLSLDNFAELKNPDNSYDGLVTQDFEGLNVEFATSMEGQKGGWENSGKVRTLDDGTQTAVYWSDTKDNDYGLRSFAIQPEKPCYVTFDFIVANRNLPTEIANIYANEDLTHPSEDACDRIPRGITASSLDAQDLYQKKFLTSDPEHLWQTGITQTTSDFPVLVFEMNRRGGDQAKYEGEPEAENRLLISNVRFYESAQDLPEQDRTQIRFDFDDTAGTVKFEYSIAYSENSNTYNNSIEIPKSGQIVTVPLNSRIKATYQPFGNIGEGAFSGKGWNIDNPDGSPILKDSKSYSISGSQLDKQSTPGSPYIASFDCELGQLPNEMNLYRKASDSSDWVRVNGVDENIAKIGRYYQTQQVGTDRVQQWRIEIEPPAAGYDTVQVKDTSYTNNFKVIESTEEKLEPSTGGSSAGKTNGNYYYECTPGDHLRYIDFEFSKTGAPTRKARAIIWPTMSWEEAYGYADVDGAMSINGLKQTGDSWNTISPFDFDDHVGWIDMENGPFRTFVYDPDLTEAEGVPVFSTTPVDHTVKTYYKTSFTAAEDGTLSFDLCFPEYFTRDAISGKYSVFAFYLYHNGERVTHRNSSDTRDVDYWYSAEVKDQWRTITLQNVKKGDTISFEFSRLGSQSQLDTNVYAAIKNLSYANGDITVKVETAGQGSVTANGKTLPENNLYGRGSQVILNAKPEAGWTFAG